MWGILPPISAYSFRHLHSPALQNPFQDPFAARATLSYHLDLPEGKSRSVASVTDFEVPTIFGANPLDW